MVSTNPLISNSSSLCTNLFVTGPWTLFTIGITVTFMSHSFFQFPERSRYQSFFSFSFNLTLWSSGTAKSKILQVSFSCWLSRGLAIWPRLGDPFVSQNLREVLRISFSWKDSGFVHIPFVCMVIFKLLAQFFSGSHLSTKTCLVLNSFCASLLHYIYDTTDRFFSITT